MANNDSINSSNPIVQIVSTSTGTTQALTTQIPLDNTIPQNTEGDEILTLAITPKFSTSNLLIEFICPLNPNTGVFNYASVALFQDSTANALCATNTATNNSSTRCNMLRYIMTSGTTSSTTFKVRAGPGAAITIYTNSSDGAGGQACGTVSATTLKITEYL